ncbi:MAG: hypothetical protein ACOY82_18130 [Pseudomonadota bacterium]
MSNPFLRTLAVLAISFGIAAPVAAGPRAGDAGPLTPQARGDLARAFVSKWGGYAQRVYEVPVGVWAKRMVPSFVAADPTNFRNAMKRDTFEGALAELAGTGHRLADQQVIDRYARAASSSLSMKDAAAIGGKALGSTTGDLVFTAVTPCRIVDTRVAGGAISANSSRAFLGLAVNSGANFTSQGGSGTNCNVAAVGASAIAINVTAVTPSGAGFATVYKSGESRPLAASVNYTAGAIVNNTVVVGVPNPLAITDFVIYTFAQADYVVDIVGYFAPPQATNLQCTQTALQSFTIAAGASTFFNNPLCPTGYHEVMPYCYSSDAGVNSAGSGTNSNTAGLATFCAWHNTTGGSRTVFGGSICCRVPGR